MILLKFLIFQDQFEDIKVYFFNIIAKFENKICLIPDLEYALML